MAEAIVELRGLSKSYPVGDEMLPVLKGITLTIGAGEYVAVMGPSGSGKSTLLNLLGLLDVPDGGDYFLAGENVSKLHDDALAYHRNAHIGFIFQSFNLFPVLTAQENVEFPLLQLELMTRQERRRRAALTLDVVGLTRYAHHRPSQLSGGQRQRVAIARALATGPKIVLADEPTANLDHKTGESILALMKEINRKMRTTFIFSTHDQKVINFADHYVGMEDGELRFLGLRKDDQWVISDDRRKGERRKGERRQAMRVGSTDGVTGLRSDEQ
jgi:putative ABC transport system ATP-binding protein